MIRLTRHTRSHRPGWARPALHWIPSRPFAKTAWYPCMGVVLGPTAWTAYCATCRLRPLDRMPSGTTFCGLRVWPVGRSNGLGPASGSAWRVSRCMDWGLRLGVGRCHRQHPGFIQLSTAASIESSFASPAHDGQWMLAHPLQGFTLYFGPAPRGTVVPVSNHPRGPGLGGRIPPPPGGQGPDHHEVWPPLLERRVPRRPGGPPWGRRQKPRPAERVRVDIVARLACFKTPFLWAFRTLFSRVEDGEC